MDVIGTVDKSRESSTFLYFKKLQKAAGKSIFQGPEKNLVPKLDPYQQFSVKITLNILASGTVFFDTTAWTIFRCFDLEFYRYVNYNYLLNNDKLHQNQK